jgi:hypothetical protein
MVTEVRNDTKTESKYAKRRDKGVLCWELLSGRTSAVEKKAPKKTAERRRTGLWGYDNDELRARQARGESTSPAQGCTCDRCHNARNEACNRHVTNEVAPVVNYGDNYRGPVVNFGVPPRNVFRGLSYDAAYIDEASVVPPVDDENPPEVDWDRWQSVMNRLRYFEPREAYRLRGVFDID